MQSFLLFCIGAVCAWAFKRKNTCGGLGKWRPIAGGVAAAFPNIDSLPGFIGCNICFQYVHGWTWSVFLIPLYALALAGAFAWYTKHHWKQFYPFMMGCMFAGLAFSLFTDEGIRVLYPALEWRMALNVLFAFDLYLFGISILTIVIYWIVKKWPRDIARVGLLLMIIYVGAVSTFYMKAKSFAQSYVEVAKLDVKSINVLPQPISPFNWRIIVETNDDRLHDTRISLFHNEEQKLDEKARRSARIQALYKPTNMAVWRIYRRFGNRNPKGVELVWQEQEKDAAFRWFARYAVFQDLVDYDAKSCTRFKDLRYLAARKDKAGYIMVCEGDSERSYVYKSDKSGKYGLLN